MLTRYFCHAGELRKLALLFSVLVSAVPALAAEPITEQEAHGIGVEAYLYFHPIVTMEVTRQQSTNIEPGRELGKGP
jgi:hypothetical protein